MKNIDVTNMNWEEMMMLAGGVMMTDGVKDYYPGSQTLEAIMEDITFEVETDQIVGYFKTLIMQTMTMNQTRFVFAVPGVIEKYSDRKVMMIVTGMLTPVQAPEGQQSVSVKPGIHLATKEEFDEGEKSAPMMFKMLVFDKKLVKIIEKEIKHFTNIVKSNINHFNKIGDGKEDKLQ